jgi:hypothetical protein
MSKRKVGLLVLGVMVLGALLPALIAPGLADAETMHYGWMVYTPNHPNGCAPLPYDCYVVFVFPDGP